MKIAINISEYDQEWIRNAYGIPAEINTVIAEAIISGKELVKCKDCRYGEIDDEAFPWQYFCGYTGDNWNDENHFCNYGERKKDND